MNLEHILAISAAIIIRNNTECLSVISRTRTKEVKGALVTPVRKAIIPRIVNRLGYSQPVVDDDIYERSLQIKKDHMEKIVLVKTRNKSGDFVVTKKITEFYPASNSYSVWMASIENNNNYISSIELSPEIGGKRLNIAVAYRLDNDRFKIKIRDYDYGNSEDTYNYILRNKYICEFIVDINSHTRTTAGKSLPSMCDLASFATQVLLYDAVDTMKKYFRKI